jgi:hypothetical protein
MAGALFIAGAEFTDGARLIDGALLAVKVGFFRVGAGGFGRATGILPAGGIWEKVVPGTFAGTGEDGCSFNTAGAGDAEVTGD